MATIWRDFRRKTGKKDTYSWPPDDSISELSPQTQQVSTNSAQNARRESAEETGQYSDGAADVPNITSKMRNLSVSRSGRCKNKNRQRNSVFEAPYDPDAAATAVPGTERATTRQSRSTAPPQSSTDQTSKGERGSVARVMPPTGGGDVVNTYTQQGGVTRTAVPTDAGYSFQGLGVSAVSGTVNTSPAQRYQQSIGRSTAL